MFNPGLYFETLELTKTQVSINLGLESSMIRASENAMHYALSLF